MCSFTWLVLISSLFIPCKCDYTPFSFQSLNSSWGSFVKLSIDIVNTESISTKILFYQICASSRCSSTQVWVIFHLSITPYHSLTIHLTSLHIEVVWVRLFINTGAWVYQAYPLLPSSVLSTFSKNIFLEMCCLVPVTLGVELFFFLTT